MNLIVKTDFGSDFRCEIVKVENANVYYKHNVNDKTWLDVPANNVKYIQIVGHRNI